MVPGASVYLGKFVLFGWCIGVISTLLALQCREWWRQWDDCVMELSKYQNMFPTAFECDTSCHEQRWDEIRKAGLRVSLPDE